MMLFLCTLLVTGAAAAVVEPHTGVEFERRLERDGVDLALTGVDRRRALGMDAYAIAHYADERALPADAGLSPEERLERYIDTAAHKLIVFHGVYRRVPPHGIRLSWKKHFKDLGLEPREDFIEAFDRPFSRGERLYFEADPEGCLTVRHGETLLGAWDDPELTRALWAMCLGPVSEVVARENLVAREDAARDMAQSAPEALRAETAERATP